MSTEDPLDLEAQHQDRADDEARIRLELEQERDDLKWLMSSKRGRRIVWRHLVKAKTFGPTFDADAMVMAKMAGQRDLGLEQISLIHEHCYEHYGAMVKENTHDGSSNTN